VQVDNCEIDVELIRDSEIPEANKKIEEIIEITKKELQTEIDDKNVEMLPKVVKASAEETFTPFREEIHSRLADTAGRVQSMRVCVYVCVCVCVCTCVCVCG